MSPTLAALIADVYSLTNRPDLEAQTILAVKAATLKAHQSDFYPKDIFESGIVFEAEEYIQALEFRLLIPKFRALAYIRKSDINGTDTLPFLEVITPNNSLDSYYVNRVDVCYLAGSVINIKSSTLLQYALFGCYLNPDIGTDTYDSWIATDHPYLIVWDATSTVYKSIGFDEQAALFQKLVAEQYAELKMELATKGE